MDQTKFAIIAIVVAVPVISFYVWSIENTAPREEKDKISVLVSFYPLYEFSNAIGGEKVEVSLLVPEGIEPHDWEPAIDDLQMIKNSDLLVINGAGFEKWIEQAQHINKKIVIVDTSEGIQKISSSNENHDIEANELTYDPHYWLDPKLAQVQIRNIEKAFSDADKNNKKYYELNSEIYIEKLSILDEKIRNELSGCKKDFIAFHDAFSYFSNEYGLVQHNIIQTNDPHGEPTLKTLQRVIELAKQLELQIIFSEESVDQRTSEIIAKEIGGEVLILSPIEIINKNESYISKMESNLNNLREALCN